MPNNWMPPANMGWPYNQNMLYQQQQQQQQQLQPTNNMLRVMGPESAKTYPLGRDSTVVLFDAENPIFYLKTTDDSGFAAPLRKFKFQEIIEQPETQPTEEFDASYFATKNDLETLQNDISELKDMLKGLVD